MQKVIVAMSGGVDSSVAAALLQEQGFEVEGMFMKNWSPDSLQALTDCPWEQDQADAAAVCKHLGIPFRSINFEREYKDRVVDYFLREYAAGRTPNPDIMCNKEIKFDAFLKAAEEMGADYIATGHYVQREGSQLVRGVDPKKDQSYFLYTLNKNQLERSLFPVGGMPKSQVRELAVKFGLPTATKKDSQGICFIGHIDLKEFLMSQITAKPGSTYLLGEGDSLAERIEKAAVVGKHQGAMFYTIGERTGQCVDNRLYRLITGDTQVKPTYLVATDAGENKLYVSTSHDDKNLYTHELYLDGYYPTGGEVNQPIELTVDALQSRLLSCQIRYQQIPVDVEKIELQEGKVKITTNQPLWAVAAGQSLVLYEDDVVVGGGVVCAITH